MAAPKYAKRTEKYVGTWDKEDKDGKEIELTRGAELVFGDARDTRITKKTKHICDFRFQSRF